MAAGVIARSTTLISTLRSAAAPKLQPSGPMLNLPRRGYHIDLGAREKALLEEDAALKRFKSYKNTVKRVSKVGDALTILVVAAGEAEAERMATSEFFSTIS